VVKIAYVLKGYPRLSESFIANEVRLLKELGVDLKLFSIKSGDALGADPNLPCAHYLPVVTSLSQTNLIAWLKQNLPAFSDDQWYWINNDFSRYLATLSFALGSAFKYRVGRSWGIKKTFIKEFLFATHIARLIKSDSVITHLHAHFCHDATTVAWMVSRLTGLPYSFTAHAKDIYQSRLNPKDLLDRKLDAAKFAVTCTQTNVEFLRGRCNDPQKIHGIYHGLNTQQFLPRSTSAPPVAATKLISVGRMVEKKGFIYLIEACRILRDRGISFSLEIRVICCASPLLSLICETT
jgi:glycosyltransferase involved in cell wall biosynthesis